MIEVVAAGVSTPGRVREHNEDCHAVVSPEDPTLIERKGHLLAIADGLGGLNSGEVASATAIRSIVESYYAPTSPSRVEPALNHAVQVANLKVHDGARGNPGQRGMQTTLTCLVLAGRSAYIAHVADHPRRNVLTRTLGNQLLLRPDFRRIPLETGDTFIICTDGLWSEVSDGEIATAADLQSPDEGCRYLIDLQLGRSSLDNATVEVVKVVSLDDMPPTDSDGWLNTIVNRFVGPRSGDANRSGRPRP
jgi:protein phosphatase